MARKSTKNKKNKLALFLPLILLALAVPIIVASNINNQTKTNVKADTSPEQIYGVTTDNITSVGDIVTSLQKLSHKPTTRIVFDEFAPASDYANATSQIHGVSHVMGEILDSFYVKQYTPTTHKARVTEYLDTLGDSVDIWEIGNEINGEWLGSTPDVVVKMTDAYDQVKARGKVAALTLYYNGLDDVHNCYENKNNLMLRWAQTNIPDRMKQGLDYVFISYYDDDCPPDYKNASYGVSTNWNSVFTQVHAMFPNAKIGFGEVGTTVASQKEAFINRYYGLNVNVPNYVGGYFWWYFRQDMVPYTKTLWTTLNNAFTNMPVPTGAEYPTTTPMTSTEPPTPTPTSITLPTATPVPTAMSTSTAASNLGYTAIGPKIDNYNSNTIVGSKITTGGSARKLQSISVYADNIDAAPYNRFQVAVYTNKNGKPGALVAKSRSATLKGKSWNTVALSTTLGANKTYWLLYNTNGRTSKMNNMHYIDASSKMAVYTTQSFGTWPTTLNKGSLWTGKFSIYATVR